MVTLIWSLLTIYAALVYGPMAAWLVELFPQNIRYTSLSLAYNIGNGWFGNFVPTIGFAIVMCTGNIYSGLWYPAIFAFVSFIIGMLFLKETKNRDI